METILKIIVCSIVSIAGASYIGFQIYWAFRLNKDFKIYGEVSNQIINRCSPYPHHSYSSSLKDIAMLYRDRQNLTILIKYGLSKQQVAAIWRIESFDNVLLKRRFLGIPI